MMALLAGGCLGLIALIGLQADRLPMELVLAGALGLIVLVVVLQKIELGLTVLVVVGGTVGFSIGTGTQSAITLAMLLVSLLAAIWIIRMVAARQLRLVASGLNMPLVAFLGSGILSWIAARLAAGSSAQLPGNILSVQVGQFAVYALSALAFFLGANHPLGERTLKAWTVFLVAVGVLVMVSDVVAGWRHTVGMWFGSLYMWPVVFPVAQALFNQRLPRSWKLVSWSVVGLWTVWAVRTSMSFKGGWVPALLALFLLLSLKSRRYLLVGFLSIGLVVLAAGPERVLGALLQSEESSASPIRSALWLDVFRMGLRSPVFGLGLATYSYHWQDPTFESISYRYVSTSAFRRDAYNPPAHNMYADVFAQMGALGMVFLLWTLLAGIRLGFLASRQAPAGFSQAYACSVLCGFVSMVISSFFFADWLLPYVYNIGLRGFPQAAYTWLLLGTLVPLATMGRSVGAEARPMACGSSSGVTSRSGGSAGRGGCA